MADLRASLFRLSSLAKVSELKKNAFRKISLQLGDLSNTYARARKTEESMQSSLQKLADLKAEKEGYQTTFLTLGQEKNDVLRDHETVNQQIVAIENTITSLQAELPILTP